MSKTPPFSDQTCHDCLRPLLASLGRSYNSRLLYSTYLYLDFHLFHDKPKRKQQGNMLWWQQPKAPITIIIIVVWQQPMITMTPNPGPNHHHRHHCGLTRTPGPLAPPERSRPSLKMTARSYSWTTCKVLEYFKFGIFNAVIHIVITILSSTKNVRVR